MEERNYKKKTNDCKQTKKEMQIDPEKQTT